MSSNEKEEEGKKKLAHDYINAYASHRINNRSKENPKPYSLLSYTSDENRFFIFVIIDDCLIARKSMQSLI